MPAYAGAATPAVTPGTTSNGTPPAASASPSSPPRPNTNGSPPLTRTTRFPPRPSSTSSALISSCDIAAAPGSLPTYRSSASGRAPSSAPAGISRSYRIASAEATSSSDRRVISPGSPGPAPTRYTMPLTRGTLSGGHEPPALRRELLGAGRARPLGHAAADRAGRFVERHLEPIANPPRSVGQPDEGGQCHRAVLATRRVHADGRVASGLQLTDHVAFLRQARVGGDITEAGEHGGDLVVCRARLARRPSLAGGGNERGPVEGPPFPAAPRGAETRLREHERVEVPVGEPPQPGVDVAAHVAHV